MKKSVKRIIAVAIGFAFAMLLMSVFIYIGYTNAYSSGVDTFNVNVLGIPIYNLTKVGSKYVGESKGIYMGLLCGICMLVAFAVKIVIEKVKKK